MNPTPINRKDQIQSAQSAPDYTRRFRFFQRTAAMPAFPPINKLQPTRRQALANLAELLAEGTLSPAAQRRARFLFERALQIAGAPPAQAAQRAAAAATSGAALANCRLVYVHGICQHLPGFSDPWWAALHEFETTAFGDGVLGQTRLE